MIKMKKRGISPVVATVLLISIAVVLAAIIFLWARSFIQEGGEKFGEPVSAACEDVNIRVGSSAGQITIQNNGNVPLWGIDINKISFGSVESYGEDLTAIGVGESATIDLPSGIDSGDEISVVPILLGDLEGSNQAFTCDSEFGVNLVVS